MDLFIICTLCMSENQRRKKKGFLKVMETHWPNKLTSILSGSEVKQINKEQNMPFIFVFSPPRNKRVECGGLLMFELKVKFCFVCFMKPSVEPPVESLLKKYCFWNNYQKWLNVPHVNLWMLVRLTFSTEGERKMKCRFNERDKNRPESVKWNWKSSLGFIMNDTFIPDRLRPGLTTAATLLTSGKCVKWTSSFLF